MADRKRTAPDNGHQMKHHSPHEDDGGGSLDSTVHHMHKLAEIDMVGEDLNDPDSSTLLQQSDLIEDEPLDLEDPVLAVELADDPVRLYLREIGQVKLLNADEEFRLAIVQCQDRGRRDQV